MPSGTMADVITSTANPQVKAIVKLAKRSERDATGLFVVEGVREAGRAVAAGIAVDTLVVAPDLVPRGGADVVRAARATGARVLEVADHVFQRVSARTGPDGVLLVARQPATDLAALGLGGTPLVLVAAGIEKPGNLGAMLRSAAAAGAAALVLADPVTDVFNPNAVRASMGALFTVPVAVGSSTEVVAWARAVGLRLVVTTPRADTPHWDAPLAGPAAVVIGSEADGADDAWFAAADDLVTIPMPGDDGVDSLNAASTAAVLLFEAVRQRATATPERKGV